MTVYEKMISEADRLVADGMSSVPGIREKKYREADELRTRAELLPVEEAERIIPPCKGPVCKVRVCTGCESNGVTE